MKSLLATEGKNRAYFINTRNQRRGEIGKGAGGQHQPGGGCTEPVGSSNQLSTGKCLQNYRMVITRKGRTKLEWDFAWELSQWVLNVGSSHRIYLTYPV